MKKAIRIILSPVVVLTTLIPAIVIVVVCMIGFFAVWAIGGPKKAVDEALTAIAGTWDWGRKLPGSILHQWIAGEIY